MSLKELNPSPLFSTKKKKISHYKKFMIMADMNLHEQLLRIIKKEIPSKSRILVLGSGEGALDQRLKDSGFEVWSSDIEDTNFKADTKYIHADFNNCDDMNIIAKSKEKYFDLVLSVEIIEHIENLDLYFSTAGKVLKNGGKLIISTPNVKSWYSRLYFFINGIFPTFDDMAYSEYGHMNPVGVEEIHRILIKNNFSNKISSYDGGYLPKLWLSGSLKSFIFNISGFILRIFMRGRKDGWCSITLAKKSLK